MKYYLIETTDALTCATLRYHVYGVLKNDTIYNQYGVPLYIISIYTTSCMEVTV
jgi:hypothetical protein